MMMGKRLLTAGVFFLLLVAALAGCRAEEPEPVDLSGGEEEGAPWVVRVNDETVSVDRFEKNFALIEHSYNELYGPSIWKETMNGMPLAEAVKRNIIETMIEERLVVAYMQDKVGYTVDAEELEKSVAAFQENTEGDTALQALHREMGIDEAFIRREIANQLTMLAFDAHLREQITEDEALLEKRYTDYVVKVRARHILVEDETLAQSLYEELEEGADFAALAEEHSVDPGSKNNGGDLGYFPRGMMVPAFEETAFSLEVGALSPPIPSKFGYHIILLEDKQTVEAVIENGADEEEIQAYRDHVVKALFEEERDALYKQLIEEATIEAEEAVIDSLIQPEAPEASDE